MTKYVLDTHVWVWFNEGDSTLSKKIRGVINDAIHDGELYLSSISIWEVSMLVSKGRLKLTMPTLDWEKQSIKKLNIQTIPLTPEIVDDSCNLPGEFHSDPADRIIVASTRVSNSCLLTRDKNILTYSRKKFVNALKA